MLLCLCFIKNNDNNDNYEKNDSGVRYVLNIAII